MINRTKIRAAATSRRRVAHMIERQAPAMHPDCADCGCQYAAMRGYPECPGQCAAVPYVAPEPAAPLRVFVYFNLHRHCWSIKALNGPDCGRVIGHAVSVALSGVVFKVSQAGRARVLAEGRKNVHAGVVGELLATGTVDFSAALPLMDTDAALPVTYNPYRFASFVENVTDKHLPVTRASFALLIGRAVFAEGAE